MPLKHTERVHHEKWQAYNFRVPMTLVPCLLYEQLYRLARLQNVWGEAIVQLELLDGLNSVS